MAGDSRRRLPAPIRIWRGIRQQLHRSGQSVLAGTRRPDNPLPAAERLRRPDRVPLVDRQGQRPGGRGQPVHGERREAAACHVGDQPVEHAEFPVRVEGRHNRQCADVIRRGSRVARPCVPGNARHRGAAGPIGRARGGVRCRRRSGRQAGARPEVRGDRTRPRAGAVAVHVRVGSGGSDPTAGRGVQRGRGRLAARATRGRDGPADDRTYGRDAARPRRGRRLRALPRRATSRPARRRYGRRGVHRPSRVDLRRGDRGGREHRRRRDSRPVSVRRPVRRRTWRGVGDRRRGDDDFCSHAGTRADGGGGQPCPGPRRAQGGGRAPDSAEPREQRIRPMGTQGQCAAVALGDRGGGPAGRAGHPAVLDSTRPTRRRNRPQAPEQPQGVRPDCAGVRPGGERPAPGHRRTAQAGPEREPATTGRPAADALPVPGRGRRDVAVGEPGGRHGRDQRRSRRRRRRIRRPPGWSSTCARTSWPSSRKPPIWPGQPRDTSTSPTRFRSACRG